MACIEDHNTGAGWFDPQPTGWAHYGTGGRALYRDRMLDVAFFAGGLGAVMLLGVSYRAMCLAPGRAHMSPSQPTAVVPLALPIDAPAFEPMLRGSVAGFRASGLVHIHISATAIQVLSRAGRRESIRRIDRGVHFADSVILLA